MSLQEWWRNKSGKAKTITVLATLLILQIGLCFGTPSIVSFYQAIFHIKLRGDEEFGPNVGYMFIEALLALMTAIVLLVVVVSYIVGKIVGRVAQPKEDE
jgi:hypothetical protein